MMSSMLGVAAVPRRRSTTVTAAVMRVGDAADDLHGACIALLGKRHEIVENRRRRRRAA